MGRWQGHRRSFKPQTLAGQVPSGRWFSGKVPGKSPVWVETLPLGLFTSEWERWIHFSPFWVLQPPPSSEGEEFTSDSCQQEGNLSSSPPSSGSWQPLEVPVTPRQLRPMASTQLTIPLQSCFQQSQLHKLYPKYKLFSILRVPANQKTLLLFSDCFKMSVYFTLPNTWHKGRGIP